MKKSLSIKQPWASLICTPRIYNPKLGIKDIENRTWSTKHRDRIYVHVSAKTAGELTELLTEEQYLSLPNYMFLSKNYPVSAIIGEVDIVDCVINHVSIWAERTPSVSPHYPNGLPSEIGKGRKDVIYNWVLANPVLYDEPILNVKGKLSLWEFNRELI